jgi:hypothetical protein
VLIVEIICILAAFITLGALFRREHDHTSISDLQLSADETVTVVVAARNEADNIASLLDTITDLDGPVSRVVLVDDRSTDGTAELARKYEKRLPLEILTISGDHPPAGWCGKNHALHHAIVNGIDTRWILFLDADIVLHPLALKSALHQALQLKLDGLSLIPRRSRTVWFDDAIDDVITSAVYLLVGPLCEVDGRQRTFASGSFLLVKRDPYIDVGGHAAVRSRIVEDIALASLIGHKEGFFGVRSAPHLASLRSYRSRPELLSAWVRVFADIARGGRGLWASTTLTVVASFTGIAAISLPISHLKRPLEYTPWALLATGVFIVRWLNGKRERAYLAVLAPFTITLTACTLALSALRSFGLAGRTLWKGTRSAEKNSRPVLDAIMHASMMHRHMVSILHLDDGLSASVLAQQLTFALAKTWNIHPKLREVWQEPTGWFWVGTKSPEVSIFDGSAIDLVTKLQTSSSSIPFQVFVLPRENGVSVFFSMDHTYGDAQSLLLLISDVMAALSPSPSKFMCRCVMAVNDHNHLRKGRRQLLPFVFSPRLWLSAPRARQIFASQGRPYWNTIDLGKVDPAHAQSRFFGAILHAMTALQKTGRVRLRVPLPLPGEMKQSGLVNRFVPVIVERDVVDLRRLKVDDMGRDAWSEILVLLRSETARANLVELAFLSKVLPDCWPTINTSHARSPNTLNASWLPLLPEVDFPGFVVQGLDLWVGTPGVLGYVIGGRLMVAVHGFEDESWSRFEASLTQCRRDHVLALGEREREHEQVHPPPLRHRSRR